jgi:flagellum-specific peptidoglycan hydrolase FlgJ
MASEITLAGRKFQAWHLAALAGVVVLLWPRKARASAMPATTLDGVTDRAEWTQRLFTAVTNILPELSTNSKLLVIAHAALETGYPPYRRDSAAKCNNIFNITTGSKWLKDGKPFCIGGDTTYSQLGPDGKPLPITQKWRSYSSIEVALTDYWGFLGSRANLRAARDALIAGNPDDFARLLRAASYYDAPEDLYARGLRGGMAGARKYLPFV